MTWNETKRLRQIRQRAERKANPRPGDEEAKKARNKKRWHEVRKHDQEYLTKRVTGVKAKRWALFGGTLELFNKFWEDQEGCCAICGKELNLPQRQDNKRAAEAQFDHCHNTLRPRGILCIPCNTKLGWYEKHKGIIEEYISCP